MQLGTNGTVNPDDFDRMMDILKGVKKVVVLNAKVPRPVGGPGQPDPRRRREEVQERGARRLAQHRRRPSRVLLGRRHPSPSRGRPVLRPADRRIPCSRRLVGQFLRPDVGAGCSVCQAGQPKCCFCVRSEPWSSASSSAVWPSAPCLAASCPVAPRSSSAHHYTVKTVTKLRDLSQKSTVYWSDGVTKMDELGLQDRQNVTYTELASSPGGQRVINAVISTEDRTFWTNDGIDLGGVFRAFVTNVTSGGIEQGGSTITQQLVKNRILSPARDVNRKVKEIEDALRLNEKFSKKKILEEYLNTVYFGQNSYGIKSAASRFFITSDPGAPYPRGKRLDELTIGEAALARRGDREPRRHQPVHVPVAAIKRRGDVLQAEVGQGYITQAEADAANNEPLPTWLPQARAAPEEPAHRRSARPPAQRPAPRLHAEGAPRRAPQGWPHDHHHLRQEPAGGSRRRDHANALPSSPSGPDWGSSLVAIDPPTGAVKAMGQTSDFADSQYNIATHEVGRQPGSTWKVITLAAALMNGYSPNDTVDGQDPCSVPKVFGNASTINAGDGEGGFNRPVASDGRIGQLRVRAPLDERGPGQGDGHGPQDGHHPATAVSPPHPLDRRHRGHAARDGDGDGHHRQRRRAPDALLRAEGGSAQRERADRRVQPCGARRSCARSGRRPVRATRAARRDHRRHRHQGGAARSRALRQDRHHRPPQRRLVHRRHAAARHVGVVRQSHHQPAVGGLRR